MSKRTTLHGLVLRTKPYRETSLMVDVFTREQGRLTGIRKGYRNRRGQISIQPFQLAVLNTSNSQGLVNIYEFDLQKNLAPVEKVAAGFYVLEIVFRAMGERQVETRLFDVVIGVLEMLEQTDSEKPALRYLERTLLDELGYGIDFRYAEDLTGESREIADGQMYDFISGHGFVTARSSQDNGLVFSGEEIRDIAHERYTSAKTAAKARQLYQSALIALIGEQPLQSRKLLEAHHD